MEVQNDVKPGSLLTDEYGLNDLIIEIENKMFTHRPDLFGMLGIAREIAGIQNIQFKSPDWYLHVPADTAERSIDLPLVVKNGLAELVPRFMAVAMNGIAVKPSPLKIQTYLSRIGIRPINNVVDITNYMMYLTAQPLHAYDYDKVLALSHGGGAATLLTRFPEKDEEISLLNGKTVKPQPDAIIIRNRYHGYRPGRHYGRRRYRGWRRY